jgi:hypothetical protein
VICGVSRFVALTKMKPMFFSLILALLSGCAASAPLAVRVTLGEPTHRVDPSNSSSAGYKSIEFPVCLTNASESPVWIYTQRREDPSYRLYLRDTAKARWKDETMVKCGLGSDFRRLASGEFISSTVWVPADRIGRQLRVELPVYARPDYKAKPRNVVSEVSPVR